jgi:hypothetical protein
VFTESLSGSGSIRQNSFVRKDCDVNCTIRHHIPKYNNTRHIMAVRSSHRKTQDDWMVTGEGRGRMRSWYATNPTFAWNASGTIRKISVGITDLWGYNETWKFSNTEREQEALNRDVWCFVFRLYTHACAD